ncbi:adhesin [Stenotrophomonas sp. SMYL20]|uniref:adhesin n=1 Tax=Stenotrophomonas sp. SMYL20 TaxID=3076043 RepID=UPI002E798E9E|nr:adhesin [Stenotrophomonas sp. SMYL20]
MIRPIIALLTASLAACASHPADAVQCPEATITYIGSETVDAVVLGRFQISTEGSQALRLPLASVDRQAHAHAVSTDIRDEHGLAWRPFSVVLEELKPPAADLVIARGEIETFLYDGKGAFLPGAVQKGQELSIVVRDLQGCAHRSMPFAPELR